MKSSVLVDLNVILDVLENREPWVRDAAKTCAVCGSGRVVGYVPAHALTTIYYIVRKRGGKALADKAIDWVLSLFKVAPSDAMVFKKARESAIDDYEDAVVAASALAVNCTHVVTRNVLHFKFSPVPAVTPEEFVKRLVSKGRQ